MMERADSSKKLYSRLHLWAFTQLRFFSISVVLFFILWLSSSAGYSLSKLKGLVASSSTSKEEQKVDANSTYSVEWDNHGWFYILVRVAFFLWSGSRLFGFIGAGATVGQLFGSLFATGMASLGPFLLLFAALLMEFAAQSSKGINKDVSHNSHLPEELTPIRALADQLEGTKEEEHKKYRGMVVEYIMVNNNMTVDGIDFYVTDSFGEGFYDSCKDVKFGTMNSRAIQFIGIGAGAQNFKVAVGDVIYIEANSGAVKRVGRSDAFATEFDLQAEEYVPLPKGEVHKKEEIVQVMDAWLAYAPVKNNPEDAAKRD
ncbi:uncharacterized protein LOC115963003 isoform X4 [Quercus lobata]|uniref:uncharacterized protein LOC115963003 isoform X4 n=1 Tax=Quercus lobata TaxID=97700 RepID=UPI001245DFB8|nr:uncharacterized protein LOC115963003 isoform X4 [Quercus lobata]